MRFCNGKSLPRMDSFGGFFGGSVVFNTVILLF